MTISPLLSPMICALVLFGFLLTAASARASAPSAPDVLPDGVVGNYLSAQIAAMRGHPREGARFIARVWRDDEQNADILHQLVLFKVAVGDIRSAFAHARDLARLKDNDSLAHLLLGLEAIDKADYPQARRHFEKFRRSRDKHLPHWLSVPQLDAWVLSGLGRTKDAIAAFDRLSRPHRRLRPFAAFQQALIYDLAAQPDLARHAYQKAMRLLYGGVFGRLGDAYGRFLERTGDQQAATRIYQRLAKNGGVAGVIGEAGLSRLARGQTPPALVASLQQGIAEILYYYSTLAAAGNRLDEAIFFARLTLLMRSSFEEAHLHLASLFERRNDFQQAIEIYRRISLRSSYGLIAGVQIAFAYEKKGMKDLTESQLFALARRHRAKALPLVALGQIYRMRREFVKSADIYSKAIARASIEADWPLYYARGIALERSGQWERAEQDLRRALALSNDNPDVLNYLGYAWVDRGHHLKRALAMLERAARARPNSEHIADSLGWAHYRLGRFRQAVHYLERAAQLGPNEAVIHDHLGDALWRVGRRVEARYQWQRVLKLEAVPEIDPKQIKRKLEEGLDQRKSLSEMRL